MKPYHDRAARGAAVSACLAALLSVVLLTWPAAARGESVESGGVGKPAEPAQEAQDPAAFEFAVGERLGVRLFERYAPDDGAGGVSNLIEFPEVSGEYVVQEDGKVFLPLLGELSVAGRTQQALREEVAQRFQHAHGRSVEFTVRILERDPVYVTGDVATPGAYRFVPAMTVLHAITLAGGLPGSAGDAWRRLDLAREQERLRQTELTLARLEAKSAVLEAEAASREATPSPTLVALVGQERAADLVQKAVAMRKLERERARAEDEAHRLIIEKLEAELAVMKEALTEAENTMVLRVKRVDAAADRHDKGLANEATYNMASDALVEARRNWHERRMALANVQRSLVEAQQVRQRLNLDDLLERERERETLKAQLTDHKITRETIAQMLLGATAYADPARGGRIKIVVLRRSVNGLADIQLDQRILLKPKDLIKVRNGLIELQLDEHALLKPGDLIKIEAGPEEQAMLPSQVR